MNKKVLNWCGVIALAIVAFLCGRYTAPKAEAPAAVADNAAAQVDPTEYSIMDLPMVDIFHRVDEIKHNVSHAP